MKTKGVKLAPARVMATSNPASAKSYVEEEDSRVKDMWDEPFFGHELPPKYKTTRMRIPEGAEKKKESADARRDLIIERTPWDEEFWGHSLPPNCTISRLRAPDNVEKGKFSGRREHKYPSSGEQQQQPDRFHRNTRISAEDTFEYNFDKTVDSYVLSEAISGGKDVWGVLPQREPGGCRDIWGMSQRDVGSVVSKGGLKGETFEERALRFGVEDWNLVGKKWTLNECKGGKRSARRGIFHSPSGSDTSSLVSTLESSSFTCGSEGSSFAKSDYSSASFNLSQIYGPSGAPVPFCNPARNSVGARSSVEAQFVELNILEKGEEPADVPDIPSDGVQVKNGNSYLEFNFLDGRMVDSDDVQGLESKSDKADCPVSSPAADDDPTCEEFARRACAPTAESPESENFFDSSHDSDWSGSHSASTDQGHTCGRNADPVEFDEDNASVYTEDRACEDWSSDSHFYDVETSITPFNTLSSSGSKGLSSDLVSDADSKEVAGTVGNSNLELVESVQVAVKPLEERRTARSPKRILATPRKTRSLGSVLSHHLAFTAVPSLRYKTPVPTCSPADRKGSPAKVTAACIEWLWSEKDSKKGVQALRALAEREIAERDRVSSPPVRNLDAAFRESRTYGVGKIQPVLNKAPTGETSKRLDTSPARAPRDHTKESRDSILASWAAVNPTGDSSASRLKRQSFPSVRGALSTPPSLKQHVRGVSPRKRSVSFNANGAAARAGASLTKPGAKNLALELEVLCRPFGPVLKGVRFLPNAKRGLGRPPLFSNLGPQLATGSSSVPSTITLPSLLKCGRLQCVITREGLPSYSLIMDDTEEIYAAKTLRIDVGLQDGVSHLYTFHTFKGKGKGKSVWRQWGKKEKPGSDFAGNMTVTSTICPVVTSSGVQNFVESEFVLFDAKVKEISISGPTTTSPYPRSSFSSWDTATPQRSPHGGESSTYSSPTSTYFSLPSPAPAGAFSTPVHPSSLPSQNVSLTPAGVALRSSPGLDKNVNRFKQLERRLSLESPLQSLPRLPNCGIRESLSDSETADDADSLTYGLPHSQSELAAVVVRTPLEKSQGKVSPTGDKWGWGINFLRKSFDGLLNGGGTPDQGSPSGSESEPGSAEKVTPPKHQRCNSCGNTASDDQPGHGGLSITLILPSGEHGCSANGLDGPQPLIERWRSGGKCDCGSWDLGCGLKVVDNQRVVDASGNGQPRDSTLRLYLEGKKQQMVGFALTPLKEGCYTLGFQAPISPLHAFATAVAVLHSKNPIIASKKSSESKRRLTKIPIKVVPAAARTLSRQIDELAGSRSLVSYKLVCPDPPSSPFGRA